MTTRLLWVLALLAGLLVTGTAQAGTGFFYGFSEDSPKWEGAVATNAERALGATAFRITLLWEPGQKALNSTQRTELDRAVGAAQGMRVVVGTMADRSYKAPLDAPARTQYCTFLRSVLGRYKTVNDLIVWNEPNLTWFWAPQYNADGTSAAPAAYERLLATCYDILHDFRPGVNVIAPATSTRGNDDPNASGNVSHSPVSFIEQIGEAYRESGRSKPIFDTVGHHPYPIPVGERPWLRHTGTLIGLGDWDKLMNALANAFQGTAQPLPGNCVDYHCVSIWYLETGYQTRPDPSKAWLYSGQENVSTLPDFAGGEPDSATPSADSFAPDQATQVTDATRLAYCQPYVEAIFNFLLWDENDLSRWQSAPFWYDRTPKNSYFAFKQVIGEVNSQAVDCSKLKGGVTLPRSQAALRDTSPPGSPRGVTARARNLGVRLSWLGNEERDVAGYNVYRSTVRGGPYTKVNGGPVGEDGYFDSSVVNGRTYDYVVTAIDTAANESARSQVVSGTPNIWFAWKRSTVVRVASRWRR